MAFFASPFIPPAIFPKISRSPSSLWSKTYIIEIANEFPRENWENCHVLNQIGKAKFLMLASTMFIMLVFPLPQSP